MKAMVSIDVGTTKICAVVVDAQTLRPIAVDSAANDADVSGLADGQREQDPERIWEIVCEVVANALAGNVSSDDDVAVSISGQMHGVVLVDPAGQPASHLITWRDQRATVPAWSKRYAEVNGCELHPGYGGATLSHLAAEGTLPPDVKAISLADFVAFRLTGRMLTEETHAASWGIYDIQQDCWNVEMIEALEIPAEILCEVLPSAGELGTLGRETACRLGLPAETKVCSPVGDNQASVIGAIGFAETAMVLNLGTGGQISIPSPDRDYREGFETRPMPGGGCIRVGASLCGGWSYAYLKDFCGDLVRQFTGTALSDEDLYARLNDLAGGAGDVRGLRVDTRFAGTRGDDRVRGCIDGIDVSNFRIETLALSFLEGMVRELADLAGDLATGMDCVVGSGNAIRRNPLMPRLVESIFGKRFIASVSQEEAAIGAAAASAVALGWIDKAEVSRLEAGS